MRDLRNGRRSIGDLARIRCAGGSEGGGCEYVAARFQPASTQADEEFRRTAQPFHMRPERCGGAGSKCAGEIREDAICGVPAISRTEVEHPVCDR